MLREFNVDLDLTPTVMIGPNGAGKSTLLRLLAGQLRPTEGVVHTPARIGFGPQQAVALPGFTVIEQVRYASWLAGIDRRSALREAERAIDLADLAGLADRPASRLSGGEMARLGIACALAVAPDRVLLDEPTAALDPLARQSVTAVLNSLATQGIGVLITSHTATDVRPPFTRLLVLHEGQLLWDGPVDRFFVADHQHPVVGQMAQALRER